MRLAAVQKMFLILDLATAKGAEPLLMWSSCPSTRFNLQFMPTGDKANKVLPVHWDPQVEELRVAEIPFDVR